MNSFKNIAILVSTIIGAICLLYTTFKTDVPESPQGLTKPVPSATATATGDGAKAYAETAPK